MTLKTYTLNILAGSRSFLLALSLFLPLFLHSQAIEDCNNGLDDDGDGLIDCFDTDCTCTGQCADFYYTTCNADCYFVPPCGQISLGIQWTSTVETGTYSTVVAGDMDADGIPDVVTTNVEARDLYILDGATGATKVHVVNPNATWLGGTAPAIADLDHDGFGEIVIVGDDRRIYCYEHTGALKYVSAIQVGYGARYRYSVPNIADFDNNGWAEVNIGNQVFNGQTGALLASGGPFLSAGEHPARVAVGYSFASPVPMDVLPDNFCNGCAGLELVAGNQVLSVNLNNGLVLPVVAAPAPFTDGFTSVADFDGDGDLDAVVQGRKGNLNAVYCWDIQTPTILRQYTLLNNWSEGASRVNVADLDGNGDLDISFVSNPWLYALRNNFTPLWTNPISDPSSITCSSVFDFCGDGSADIIYRSEQKLQIIEGATGNISWQDDCASATHIENPLVLDVDNDGQTEIVIECGVGGNQYIGRVIAYEAVGTPGIASRKVWNQHAYFNTNINEDLSVPQFQQNPHIVGDSLRMNTFMNQYFNPTFPSPDGLLNFTGVVCDHDSLLVSVSVCNVGDNVFPAQTPLAIYIGNPLNTAAQWVTEIPVGFTVGLGICDTFTFSIPRITNDTIFMVLNDDHSTLPPFNLGTDFPVTAVGECGFDNNIASFYVPYQPHTVYLGQDTSICDLSTLMLDASGQDLISWTWSDNSNLSSFTANGPGVYAVTATDVCLITQTDSLVVSLNTSTAVDLGLDQSICPGDSAFLSASGFDFYTWDAAAPLTCTTCPQVSLAPSNTTLVTLHAGYDYGCSARDTVLVTVYEAFDYVVDTTICYGQTVTWNGFVIQPDSSQLFQFQTINGCDSTFIVQVHGTGTGTYDITLDTSICNGSTLTINNMVFAPGDEMTFYLSTTTGCDSTVLVRVHGTPVGTYNITVDTSICTGSTVTINNTVLVPGDQKVFFLSSITGCDSTVLVRVHGTTVGTYNITIDTTICFGNTLTINNTVFAPGDEKVFNLSSITGCDSTVLIRVHGTGVGTYNFTIDTAVCLGKSLIINNTVLEPEEEMTFYLSSSTGCDSTVLVRVAPKDTFFLYESRVICYGETSDIFGVPQTTSGEYPGHFTASNGCDSTQVVSLFVYPQIQLQVDGTIACFGEANASITASITNGVDPLFYAWSSTGNQTPNLDNIPAGDYTLTVTDGNNCTETETTTIEQYPQTFFTATVDSAQCFDEYTGAVHIQTADPSLLFQFNGDPYGQTYEHPNLHAGTYFVVSQDVYGCTDSVALTVLQPPQLSLNLPADTTVVLGVSVPLQIDLGGLTPVQWIWSDTSYLSCLTCPNPIVQIPLKTTQYNLTIQDENGCKASDEMLLMVEQFIGVFIPNAIGGSGENANLVLGFNPAVRRVNLFRVFDRWGELVHETRNALPGDKSLSWDGRLGGKLVNPGVYVWQIELELADGTVLKKLGDLTVIR